MHVVMHEPRHRIEHLLRMRGRLRGDQVRVAVLRAASALFNDRHMWSTERVSVEYLQHGNARLVFSVLHAPFNEWDLSRRYGAPPEDKYFATVRLQIEEVENDLDKWDDSVVTVVRDADALERALDSRAIAFVHCLEGGVSLGSSIEEIDRNVGVCRHIDELHEITGSHQYAALGTDFDGFTKPTLGGLETPADLGRLSAARRPVWG